MSNEYHALIADQVFMGSAADMQDVADAEHVDVIVDLRAESTGCAAKNSGAKWIKVALGDNSPTAEAELFKVAIDEVASAYRAGKKVAFHCGMGRGRTGTVAAGVLLELGLAEDLDDAIAKAKAIRPEISIQPVQRQALAQVFAS
jgi:protein-tyrosine phosphatase